MVNANRRAIVSIVRACRFDLSLGERTVSIAAQRGD